jgi:hypothetical protein
MKINMGKDNISLMDNDGNIININLLEGGFSKLLKVLQAGSFKAYHEIREEKGLRDAEKCIQFGHAYGMGSKRLMEILKRPTEEGDDSIEALLNKLNTLLKKSEGVEDTETEDQEQVVEHNSKPLYILVKVTYDDGHRHQENLGAFIEEDDSFSDLFGRGRYPIMTYAKYSKAQRLIDNKYISHYWVQKVIDIKEGN